MTTPCPRVPTRDALGRVRERYECQVSSLGASAQPTRSITQTPGAVKPGDGPESDRYVTAHAFLWRLPIALPTPADDAPVPRSVRSIGPLFAPMRAPVRKRPDRPCDDCGTPVPQGSSGPLSRQCDACCPAHTREMRERRRRDAEAAGLCGLCRSPLVAGACRRCEEVAA